MLTRVERDEDNQKVTICQHRLVGRVRRIEGTLGSRHGYTVTGLSVKRVDSQSPINE